ncbi:branched-chain amino acid ABC transporter permease [Haloarchaeobius sp. TZWSO28]|uniref:branched-chain amino acid ABC transporter permease n=1 Tax=Haloarchaeobius sp. TZWSO28 TaxID=3446119 RepID=UPI003EB82147
MSGETVHGEAERDSDALTTAKALAQRYRIPIGLIVLVVLLKPLVSLPFLLGFEAIAATMLIWMLYVAAFNLLFGYTGLLSFGHAMFLGIGMYAAALGVSGHAGFPVLGFPLSTVLGMVLAAGLGYGIGRLTVQKGEIYFAFLTLAVAQAIHFTANKNPGELTGGSNGISQGVLPGFVETTRGRLSLPLPFDVAGFGSLDWYWFVALVFLAAMLALWQITRSPFGRSLVAIRENENLARAMGVNTTRYKVQSFTLSAMFAALAGALLSINDFGASLETLSVTTSGDTVLMAVLGGVRYFFGPIAGVFLWQFAEEFLTDFGVLDLGIVSLDLAADWPFFLGGIFVIVVVAAPLEGVWGFLTGRISRLVTRVRGDAE